MVLGIIGFLFNNILGSLIWGFTLYMIWFFRDPHREILRDDSVIYAAADGKIIYLENSHDGIKFAIRMSPFNVHINRAPITGEVTNIFFKPGKHKSVYFADVEKKNEKNLIIIENEIIKCEILQITGIFARRIECWVNKGEKVQQGEKIGMIRFGSQTNVLIKLKQASKTINAKVSKGDKVKAGLSIIMEIN